MEQQSRKEAAMRNFEQGYNCAQSLVLAFADLLDMEEEPLLRMVSAFGGGMGRLREVCGSVSGMFSCWAPYTAISTRKRQQRKQNCMQECRSWRTVLKKNTAQSYAGNCWGYR